MDKPADLTDLRERIAAIDAELLERLNRRLALVAQVQERKQEAGTRLIDSKREAELLQELAAANEGPLSEAAVRSLFAAVLDVMKQELRGEPRQDAPAPRPSLPAGLRTIAVIGTGLLGSSVALASKRAGIAEVRGFDADASTLREAKGAGAVDHAAPTLADAVAGAGLVIVAVPVGSLVEATRDVLAVAGPDVTVTDVGSTKRALASIEDERFVPGHPIAGGHTGGPTRGAGRPLQSGP